MVLHYDYWSEHLNELETTLERSVANYISKYQKVKIGITNNPQQKSVELDKTKKWKRMIVKYYTTSEKNVSVVVNIISAHHWDLVESEISGGGLNRCAPYYLYVLVG
jgi:hypothetical protein